MHVCTIVARNYLAQARVLGRSLNRTNPEATLWVLVVDGVHESLDEPFTLVDPDELGLGTDLAVMRLIYDVTELSTAVKPALLRALLKRTGGPVTYLDPDIQVFSSLEEIEAGARAHGLVLTPHLLSPLPVDECQPTDVDILLSGSYNLGFCSMADRPDIYGLLDWWDASLRRDCIIDHSRGRFVDQRFMDLAPGFVDDLLVLRDPGCNVAYWNLSQRTVERADDGAITVNGHQLRFFHYSGFDPRRPLRISKHQSRFTFADLPVVAELYGSYAEALRDEDFAEQARLPYAYDKTAAGLLLDRPLRRLARRAILEGELSDEIDVFGENGDTALRTWLETPHPDGPLAGLPRVLVWVASYRSDVMELFGTDPEGMMGWALEWGVQDEPALAHVLAGRTAASPPALAPGEPDPGTPEDGPASAPSDGATDAATAPVGLPSPWGVNVAGFLRAELGIGEAARQSLLTLDVAGVPAMPVEGTFVPNSRQEAQLDVVGAAEAPYAVNLLCVNPDVLEAWVAGVDPSFFAGRHTIGFWWWEVQRVPDHFGPSFDLVDEVWCGSQFVLDAFAAVSPKPTVKVRIPVVVPPVTPMTRGELGAPEDFLFLFLFDFNSALARKNPLGLVEAFTRAFESGDGASLLIKSINAENHPESAARLREAIAPHPHVQLLDRYFSATERFALLDSADCYVSLHRSEGFGLTPAETMFLGKPVIATGWSGNLDFMTHENSYLVDYELVPVGAEGAPYPADGIWADPSIDHAAQLMRRVFTERDEATAKGARAAADLRRTHSLAAAAATMSGRLTAIKAQLPALATTHGEGLAVALSRLEGTADDARRHRHGGSLPRRALLRGLKPYSFHQDRVTDDLVAATAGLARRLRDVEQALTLTRAELMAAQRRDKHGLAEMTAEARRTAALVEAHVYAVERRLDGVQGIAIEALGPMHELRESRPDPSSLPFSTYEVEDAGTVYGFQQELGASDSDDRYRRFEDLFRGSEETITERQRVYLPLLRDHAPVLDVGCGRGELLELLRGEDITARGVDLDAGMVARCTEKGLDVTLQDGVEALEAAQDASLGAVICAQVIEHLPYETFHRFFALAAQKLRPGGVLIAETVNPHAQVALKHFWLDLTHEQPVFPEVALATAGLAGFSKAYIFHPGGSGDAEVDRPRCGDYALVATR
jgi:2-polyprenyl-3-methyl-5-hydroxy-6-metoxy-1,4-benzoquinol methylase/glycosyltransferase involved in cell wall biosynthesis